MGTWPSVKAQRLLRALKRIGWQEQHQSGSHRRLLRGGQVYTFAFHDGDEIGPKMLARVARDTGLRPEDL